MELSLVIVIAVVAIVVVTTLAQRLGVAGPLLLVALGIVVSLMPFVHIPEIDPEWILVGVLPPLLYSAAVNLPALEFRRDFRPIAGLAVLLVVISAIVLGVFFWLVIPGVSLPLGVALGAILSPTDAVATSIAKRLGIAPRVVTMLEGESLLNDATALVLLRTAIAAIAGSFSLWGAIGAFAWAVLIAAVVGAVVGMLIVRVRAWVGSSASNTALSFTAPFLAYLPTEHLGGSGLVAAVVAGIVTGQQSVRRLTPEQRLSEAMNWRTIELVLEGAVFLLMGLELKDIVTDNLRAHEGLWFPFWLALSALGIILVVRAAYVSLLVWAQGRRARRIDRARLEAFGARIETLASGAPPDSRGGHPLGGPKMRERRLGAMRARVQRLLTDLDYYQASPVGWKHGTVIVWAGMRGVVTLAAAQTLTVEDTDDQRALLVFIAFLVALISLMLQGFTLPWVVRLLRFPRPAAGDGDDERERIDDELAQAGRAALTDPTLTTRSGAPFPPEVIERARARLEVAPDDESTAEGRVIAELRLALIQVQRRRLIELGSDGRFSSAVLKQALAELDAEELSLALRLGEEP
ncbi:cation:proton antiporter [Microbacterium sp.]|uniref:cation:proton antiporter n=1 Tax=Microbacterium sp. TaxID=51671 RepID=UPI0037C50973